MKLTVAMMMIGGTSGSRGLPAQVVPAERLGQAVLPSDRPQQIAGPQRPADAHDRERREQRGGRPRRPRAARVERQGVEEVPADAETPDERGGEQQHDAGERRAEGDPRNAQRRPDVPGEQKRHAGHARRRTTDPPCRARAASSPRRTTRAAPPKVIALERPHQQAEHGEDREQHQRREHPDQR